MLVNVLYILVILNGTSVPPVTMQEFNSLETCDAAAEFIVTRSSTSRHGNIIARCFRK